MTGTESTPQQPAATKRRWLLGQNRQMKQESSKIYNWTLPAAKGHFSDGVEYNACPAASICVKLCYARTGTYRFSNVLAAHERNMAMTMGIPTAWEAQMTEELKHRRYVNSWVRLHDSGDFHSDEYLMAWLRIMRSAPHVRFYCYTKEVSRFRRLVEGGEDGCPPNFLYCWSLGGKEDRLINLETERHADVFPTVEQLAAAGYSDQTESDLLAVLGPEKVGIPANRIPHLLKLQGPVETFGSLQRARDEWVDAKNERAVAKAAKSTALATGSTLAS